MVNDDAELDLLRHLIAAHAPVSADAARLADPHRSPRRPAAPAWLERAPIAGAPATRHELDCMRTGVHSVVC